VSQPILSPFARALPAAVCLLCVCRAGVAAPPPLRDAAARQIAAPIELDGLLDETVWSEAEPIGPLRQREPNENAAPTERTEVRVLYDATAMYVGVRCYDDAPEQIVATQLARDGELWGNDYVTLVLDPFFDHRNGFFFQVNPAGARTDGQISNNDSHLNRDWDGIWNAAARITGDGWQAEIEIPFKTLRFKPGQSVWGFNVERQITRKNETDRWSAALQNVSIGDLARAGRLGGLHGLHQGLGLDIRPYGSAGTDTGTRRVTGGLDVSQNITPNLNASVTVNTDFAETQADARQVNLTRFPLFFPEKRAFFLEGAGVFDVSGAGGRDLRPFFSRTIGLLDGVTVPIEVGAKAIGRAADYNIGFLDVQTRAVQDPLLDAGAVGGQNLLAMRVSRNILRQSAIGVIVTHGNPTGDGANTLVGADARFATSTFRGDRNLVFEAFVLGTDDQAAGKRDGSLGVRVGYPNDRWNVSAAWKQIGTAFRPALGFVPRTGIRKTNLNLAFQPRPGRLGIRQFFFEFRPQYITNLHNVVQDWRAFVAPFNVRTDSGEHFEFNVAPTFERLEEPFEIVDGVVIPVGSYRWTRYQAQIDTASKRRFVVHGSIEWGGFYDGTRRQVQLGVTVKAGRHLTIEANTERNDVELPAGSFATVVQALGATLSLSPNVSWDNLLQYDNESRVAAAQSRLRWILRPGNDLYVVLNRGWYRTFDGRYRPDFDRGTVKLQYTFRM
jgi:hypothetical protein